MQLTMTATLTARSLTLILSCALLLQQQGGVSGFAAQSQLFNPTAATSSAKHTTSSSSSGSPTAVSNVINDALEKDSHHIPASIYAADSNDQRYSASDWYHNIKTLPRSSILTEIKGPVLTITVWSFLVSAIHKLFRMKGMQGAAMRMCISGKPHSLLVSALGLLLVFRTNSAYQRFAEGRQIWEKILSVSRNMSRMTALYETDVGTDRKKRVLRLLSAFPYLLRHHIQPQCIKNCQQIKNKPYGLRLLGDRQTVADDNTASSPLTDIQEMLSPSTKHRFIEDRSEGGHECWVDKRKLPWNLFPNSALQKVSMSSNRPLWVCDRLSQELTSVAYGPNFTSRERLTLLGHVDKLSQCIGECERIHQTAVPLNYARHSLRSLTLWLFSLPFAMLSDTGLLTAPMMGAMAWLLLGVYQIGYSIEDPFQGSLQLSRFCDAVYRDVMYEGSSAKNIRDSAYSMSLEERKEWLEIEETDLPDSLIGATP